MALISSYSFAQDVDFTVDSDSSSSKSVKAYNKANQIKSSYETYSEKEINNPDQIISELKNNRTLQDSLKSLSDGSLDKAESKMSQIDSLFRDPMASSPVQDSISKLKGKSKKLKSKKRKIKHKSDSLVEVSNQVKSIKDEGAGASSRKLKSIKENDLDSESYAEEKVFRHNKKKNRNPSKRKKIRQGADSLVSLSEKVNSLRKSEDDTLVNDLLENDALTSGKQEKATKLKDLHALLEKSKEEQKQLFDENKIGDSLATLAEQQKLLDTTKTVYESIRNKHDYLDSLNASLHRDTQSTSKLTDQNAYKNELKTEIMNNDSIKSLDSLKESYEKVNGLKGKIKEANDNHEEYILGTGNEFLSSLFFEGIIDLPTNGEESIKFAPALGYAFNDKNSVGAGFNTEIFFNRKTQWLEPSGFRVFHKNNLIKDKFYSHTELTAEIPGWSNQKDSEFMDDAILYKLALGGGYRLVFYGNLGLDIQVQYEVLNFSKNRIFGVRGDDSPLKIRIGLKLN